MTYRFNWPADEIPSEAVLISDSQEVDSILENVGLPDKFRKDITAAFVLLGDGDYLAVWLSESSRYYEKASIYHPLPYYRPMNWNKKKLTAYWTEDNSFYQEKK